MDMENIKKVVKESIMQNFMEAAKFARRGAEKQRPKSWSKGTKSGSDKRKMREQGKRDASEMHEQYREPGYQYNPQPDDDPNDRYAKEIKQEKEEKRKRERISNAVYDWVSETGLHSRFGHTEDEAHKLLKKHIEDEYETSGEAAEHLADVYPAPEGVDPEQYKKHMEQGIHAYATAPTSEHRIKMLAGNPYLGGIDESYNRSLYYYNKLKESHDIPRHAKVTGEEVYGAMDPHAEDRKQLHGEHHDAVHEEHYQKAMETLKQTEEKTGDPSQAKSLVARNAIAAALAHASMSRSNDPTLRRIESILRAHSDALDDHFKLSQQKGDVSF